MRASVLTLSICAFLATTVANGAPLSLRVTIENLAPQKSITFAPLRVGFNGGGYDSFNNGQAASPAIISIAEGGSGADWFPAFAAADATATLGTVGGGPLLPGATMMADFMVDPAVNRFFTFASMVVPSNDHFIGNDSPMAYPIFDANGDLVVSSILQTAGDIWDAGSEVTDPMNAAFLMGGMNDLRTPENGVVNFNFSELNAYNGLTTAAGYVFSNVTNANTPVYRISFAVIPEPASALLLATMILAVGRVEQALNALWGVTERRPWSRRIPDYLAVIVIAPLTLGGAISMRAALESQTLVQKALEFPLLHLLYRSGLRWAPVVLVISALTFLYWFLPNTRVRPRSALLGGLVAGVLFNAAQVAYVALTLGAKARLDEAFAASAWVVMFLIWVYIAWAVVLLGAEVAYAHQTLSLYRREVQGKAAGTAARETIGLAIALCCARAFHDGTQPWHPDALSDSLDVPLRTVREVLRSLEQAGIVAPCGGESVGSYQMARPAEQVRVSDVLVALRGNPAVPLGVAELSRTANAIIAEVEHAGAAAAGSRSLRDLLSAAPADTRAHA